MTPEQQQLHERISSFRFDEPNASLPFAARLARENGWPDVFAARAIAEYRKFLFLAMAAGHPVSPSDQVDQVWHLHLLYTESYWNRLCKDALGKPLHHNPTRGGAAERDKFTDLYQRTLDSYRRFFGDDPPGDIWPSPKQRFSDDLHFERVSKRRVWVIPKQRIKIAMLAGLVASVVGLGLAGCNGVSEAAPFIVYGLVAVLVLLGNGGGGHVGVGSGGGDGGGDDDGDGSGDGCGGCGCGGCGD